MILFVIMQVIKSTRVVLVHVSKYHNCCICADAA